MQYQNNLPEFITSLDGRSVQIEEKDFLYFSGTSYLGMNTHPDFQALILEGMRLFGTNYGGSRLSNLKFEIYERTENYLAQLCSMEAALTCSSGTLAGQILSQYLSQHYQLVYAPKTHPALSRNQLQKERNTEQHWKEVIIEETHKNNKTFAILCNAIDPLYLQAKDFSWLEQLPKNKKTILVLDDSHGMGILGKQGEGIISQIHIPPQVEVIISASLAKAFAIPGGVILGAEKHIEALKKQPLFGGASPIIPAYLHAFLNAGILYQEQLSKIELNIQQFVSGLQNDSHFRFLSNYPVFYTANQELADQLKQKGILISSFPYPTKNSPCINRIVLNAAHTQKDIADLVDALNELLVLQE